MLLTENLNKIRFKNHKSKQSKNISPCSTHKMTLIPL